MSKRNPNKIQNNAKYRTLDFVTKNSFETGGQFTERLEHIQALYVRDDSSLCVGKQKRALAGADKTSTKQYNALIANLFSSRFQYVFIDEYQDCDSIQRQAITTIFNSVKCTVIKIGDSDQAIYNSSEDKTPDWVSQDGFLPIMTSCRYNQEIANVICKLKKGNKNIVTFS